VATQRTGFTTGFDLFTDEEVAKRAQRAGRFNIQTTGLQWHAPEVPEDTQKRRARAERFGVEYTAPDDTGLMDVGERQLVVSPALLLGSRRPRLRTTGRCALLV
jgi:hypothetical protein